MAIKSQQEIYQEFIADFESESQGKITDFNEGSNVDIVGGVVSLAANELYKKIQVEFMKTLFATSHGPEVTGGPDDLQTLAVDHFGDRFKRPGAVKSLGIATFSRPNADKGDVLIDVGTIIKTQKTSAGNSISFRVVSAVTMAGLSINASVEAMVAGPSGNVNPGTVTVLESSLSDSSVTVTNAASFGGGKNAENDAEYRQTISWLLETLKGSTLGAIEAMVKTVPGVVFAKGMEFLRFVREWDIANNQPIGAYFGLPMPTVYVADANGDASPVLLQAVNDSVRSVRAAGVRVEIVGATSLPMNWSGEVVLNPAGPNFAVLQEDLSMIRDEMTLFLQMLPVGSSFFRSIANNYILAKFGPAGTNDITSFVTGVPSADVANSGGFKIVPGVVTVNGE